MSMSSGSRVRRDGTIAMSSKPYAGRAFLPRPISTSMAATLGSATDGKVTLAALPGPVGERNSRYLREGSEATLERALDRRNAQPGAAADVDHGGTELVE